VEGYNKPHMHAFNTVLRKIGVVMANMSSKEKKIVVMCVDDSENSLIAFDCKYTLSPQLWAHK